MLKIKQRRQPFTTTDPTTWATDPTRMIPDPTGKRATASGDEKPSSANAPIFDASIAANVSAQDATAGGAIATTLVSNGRQERDGLSVSPDTSTSTKRITTVMQCENCGDAFMPRRPHGRFCSSYCRRQAWLGRNPEKAAELAERDRQRLREHVIGCGGEWVDRWHDGA